MSGEVLCDRCVDLVHPRPNCADCERERVIASSPVPDTVPHFVTNDELGDIVLDLVREWMATIHPEDAAKLITDLVERTSKEVAVYAAYQALHMYVEQLTFHVPRADLILRMRVVPAICIAIKAFAPGVLKAPDDLRQDHHSRGSGITPGGTN